MQALVIIGFGPPGQARIADMPMPSCGPNDVLIKVVAAGINPVDWKECEGHLEQFYGSYAETWIPGYDAAGLVHAIGSDVRTFKPGDRVVAFSDRRANGHNGTFAEYVRVLESDVSLVPASVDLADAAAIPTAGLTGYQALVRVGKAGLGKGDTVFIHGASGGVGSYAVQFAKALGLRVAANSSAKNIDYVRSLGADLVLDYSKGDMAAAIRQWQPQGVDAIIDCVSGGSLPDAFEALRPEGKLVSIATLVQDGDIAGDIEKAAENGFTKIFSIMEFDRIGGELGEILDLMDRGLVTPPPLARYPLKDGAKALEQAKNGGVRGKIILQIAG